MAPRKKKENEATPKKKGANAFIAGAGTVIDQEVTETLKSNFMPYAMSIIVSRAIPEIDGFKPSHRKLLYTMYNMGLLNGSTIKSANIVGRTMQLNPHGDAAIYETMVRLAKGNETLLHPFVDSKGNFGKVYSRDMAYAASRYTEAKLAPIAAELFADIDKDAVDFVDNFDRANDVYWVLNNFGGSLSDMIDTINTINQLKLIANQSDGVGSSSTASPYTIEVPHEARKNALELLEKALYKDYMALSMDEMTGGSLTNVAIQAAMTNLNLKADRYEWQVFCFVQQLLALLGVESEEIRFHRQEFVNRSEIVDDIQAMRQDIDDETALKLNPYIMPEEIDGILANRDAKILTGLSGTDAANRAREADNGQSDS